MMRLAPSLLVLSALLLLGCQDSPVEPVDDVAYARGGKPGPPDGGGEDPPPSDPGEDGNVIVTVSGVVQGRAVGILPVGGDVVRVRPVLNVEFLANMVSGGVECFPLEDGWVRGFLSLAKEEDGSASSTFQFSGVAQDGSTPTSYFLTLGGANSWDRGGWPVATPAPETVVKAAFTATQWTLTNSGGKGKKKQGCSGSGQFNGNEPVVEIRNVAPTVARPVALAFLESPFDVAPTNTLRFNHNGHGVSGCVDFTGADCAASNGGSRYQWSIPADTPIRAAAAGTVVHVDGDWPFYCSATGGIVFDQIFIAIAHTTVDGNGDSQTFATVYKHLSSILPFELGDPVVAGQLLGQSGSTGCSTDENLQFSVRAALAEGPAGESMDFLDRFRMRVDPFGWSPTDDPLAVDPYELALDRTLNQYLWRPGEAPPVE